MHAIKGSAVSDLLKERETLHLIQPPRADQMLEPREAVVYTSKHSVASLATLVLQKRASQLDRRPDWTQSTSFRHDIPEGGLEALLKTLHEDFVSSI